MATTLGVLNPFRYRGYVYDDETGLYYLRSRYYNPSWGRFINADSVLGETGQLLGHNVFAYCSNNPVCRLDSNGKFWNILAGAIIGAIVNVAVTVITSVITGDAITVGDIVSSAVSGAVAGAVASTGLGAVAQTIVGGVSGGGQYILDSVIDQQEIDLIKLAGSIAGGALAGRIDGKGIRVRGSNYQRAIQNAANVYTKVTTKVYGNLNTPLKLISQASTRLFKAARHDTIITASRYAIGSLTGNGLSGAISELSD